MNFFQSLILGIVQGLTEFLPISSSAHLVLVPYLFNWSFPAEQIFPFDVLVQLGTLVAVILYFWSDLVSIIKSFFKGLIDKQPFADPQAKLGWYLILATIPAGIVGLLLKNEVEAAFSSPKITALFLFVTAALLLLADWLGKRTRRMEDLNWVDALWMGLFQALSVFPGVSRSGSTISGGMTRNLDRSTSARFSFLMSIPVLLGAGLVSLGDLIKVPNLAGFLPVLLVGFIAAAIVGYLSIHWLLDFVKRRKLWYFAVYCVVLALIVLTVGSIRSGSPQANTAATATSTTTISSNATTENPNFQVINVQYSGSLDWLVPTMSSCANLLQNTGLVTHETAADAQSLQNSDILLRWGAPELLTTQAYQLGTENLALAVNNSNPLQSLSPKTARKVLSGEITSWGALHTECPDCFSQSYDSSFDNQQIILIFYPQGEDIQQMLVAGLMGGYPVAVSPALLVPDTNAVNQALFENNYSLGILPARGLDNGSKEVAISDAQAGAPEQPILAITRDTPQGKTADWLICLQKVLNPSSN